MFEHPKAIRNIDRALWQRLRSYAVGIGLPVGELLNQIIAAFLKDKKA